MENLTDREICQELKKFYDETENTIKAEAIISRAYSYRMSVETINEKVNAQSNAIQIGIYNINSKFREGSKNYEQVQKMVEETLESYEQSLIELSNFYDGKIEQLILRKVELEAGLVGAIIKEEYLSEKLIRKNTQKENDMVKKTVRNHMEVFLERFKDNRNKNEQINAKIISSLLDQSDVVSELNQQLADRIEKTSVEKKDNKILMEKIEKELKMINSEIERLNERKKKSIYDAIEVGSKSVTTTIRKPKVIKKITRFFINKFNTVKTIETTVIKPLQNRIDNFKENELSNMKG